MTEDLQVSASNAGVRLIQEFESFEPDAYPDPLHGWDVPTIGYGTTVYKNGVKVRRGDVITKEQAQSELASWLDSKVRPKLKAIPSFNEMHPAMVGALESFAYNLGADFYGSEGFNTISGKLKKKDWATMRSAFVLYVNPGSSVEEGLRRRRNAEASMWERGLEELSLDGPSLDAGVQPTDSWNTEKLISIVLGFRADNPSHVRSLEQLAGMLPKEALSDDASWVRTFRAPAPAPTKTERDNGFTLPVAYFSQRDSRTGQALRMCFSSCCAMLLNFLKPGVIHGANGDDEYLGRVLRFGDTTDAGAQVEALRSFGVDASFRQNLSWKDLDDQLKKGIPVPIGILHRGPVSAPKPGGHWIVVIGKSPDGDAYIVHDPFGDLDLISGTHADVSGAKLRYSKKNTGPRWMVEGDKTGWGIIATR